MVYKFFNKKEGEAKNHLVEYLRLLNADKQERSAEVQKIIDIAEKNGMRGNEIRSLMTDINPDKVRTLPQTNEERFDQMFYLLNLILNDDLLDETEFDFCNEMGLLIGYTPAKVPQIIREMYNGIKYELSEEEIKEKVKNLLK